MYDDSLASALADIRNLQAENKRLRADASAPLSQLRHAYAQLAAGTVKDQKQFANGLIAPAIRQLETIVHQQGPKTGET